MTCTNKKLLSVEGGEPAWATYRGFSILFDNPPNSLSTMGCGLRLMSCPLCEAGLELYTGLVQALRVIRAREAAEGRDLSAHHGLCLLPSYSYHVTLWDGLSERRAGKVIGEHQESLRRFLDGFPASLGGQSPFTELATCSQLMKIGFEISFRFKALSGSRRHDAVLAFLEPADSRDKEVLSALQEARSTLYAELHEQFGVGDPLRVSAPAQDSHIQDLDNGKVPDNLPGISPSKHCQPLGEPEATLLIPGKKWRIVCRYRDEKGRDKTAEYVVQKADADLLICRQKSYAPHVTLGYVCDPSKNPASSLPLGDWSEQIVGPALHGQVITFRTASLYGFTDMKSFFKV